MIKENRKILFRGKRLDNNKWVEGDLSCNRHGEEYIRCWNCEVYEAYKIDPVTRGEFTGLIGENGARIFEGDIVKLHYFFEDFDPTSLGAFENENEIVAEICWFKMGWGFESKHENNNLCNYIQDPSAELEVIGNIHDNLELLKDN